MVVGGPEAISVTRAHVTQHQSAHISHAKGSYSMLPPMPPRPDTSSQGQACPPSCLQLQPAALDGAQSTSVRADLAVAGGGTKDRPRCCHLAQEVTATTGSAQEPTTGDCLPVLDWQKWVLGVKQLTYGHGGLGPLGMESALGGHSSPDTSASTDWGRTGSLARPACHPTNTFPPSTPGTSPQPQGLATQVPELREQAGGRVSITRETLTRLRVTSHRASTLAQARPACHEGKTRLSDG